jgi:hypothetical protein
MIKTLNKYSIVLLVCIIFGCDAKLNPISISHIIDESKIIEITDPPPELKKEYYTKSIMADKMIIIGNDEITNKQLLLAREVALVMTSKHPKIRDVLGYDKYLYYSILISSNTHPCDIPEKHSYCNNPGLFTGRYSFSNLISYYPSHELIIFCHELAHAIDYFHIREKDKTFDERLTEAYNTSEWAKSRKIKNAKEYWAKASEDWFYNVKHNGEPIIEPTGPIITAYKPITVKEFINRDPKIAQLLFKWYPPVSLRKTRPDQ